MSQGLIADKVGQGCCLRRALHMDRQGGKLVQALVASHLLFFSLSQLCPVPEDGCDRN